MKRPPMTLYQNALMICLENRSCDYPALSVHGVPKTSELLLVQNVAIGMVIRDVTKNPLDNVINYGRNTGPTRNIFSVT